LLALLAVHLNERQLSHTNVLKVWNWKAAVLSALWRAPIFLAASASSGWRTATGAALAEASFRFVTSGFYGAFTQAIRALQPTWLALILVLVVVPALVQGLELVLHIIRHTPHLMRGIFVSTVITAIASLFNWYAMRKGTLLTGEDGQTFVQDLQRLPMVIALFIAAGPLALWRAFRPAKQTTG
jgi:hypothetical protein